MTDKSAFSFAKPEDSPGFLLWQTTVVWQRKIKAALEPYQLSHPQFVILAVTRWFEENKQLPNQVQIIAKTKLDKMTVSASIKKLVAMNLISRYQQADDARAKNVKLTRQGKSLIKKLAPMIETIDKRYFNSLKVSDRKAFSKSLLRLIQGNNE